MHYSMTVVLTGSDVPLLSFAARSLPLITFALKTRPGGACVWSGIARRLGLALRLAGTEVGVELVPLELLDCCLRRCGSESLLVNVGRGIVGTLGDYAPPTSLVTRLIGTCYPGRGSQEC